MNGDLKRNTITVRLTDNQLKLIRDYVKVKGLNTEADGIRRMIDGASAWLQKTSAADVTSIAERVRKLEEAVFSKYSEAELKSAVVTSHQPKLEPTPSVATDVTIDEEDKPLGYIGGRLNVGLPGNASYDDDSEASKFPSIEGD